MDSFDATVLDLKRPGMQSHSGQPSQRAAHAPRPVGRWARRGFVEHSCGRCEGGLLGAFARDRGARARDSLAGGHRYRAGVFGTPASHNFRNSHCPELTRHHRVPMRGQWSWRPSVDERCDDEDVLADLDGKWILVDRSDIDVDRETHGDCGGARKIPHAARTERWRLGACRC